MVQAIVILSRDKAALITDNIEGESIVSPRTLIRWHCCSEESVVPTLKCVEGEFGLCVDVH